MSERTWIFGKNGNRCSVERWGSEELASAALKTLEGCSRCWGCTDCSGCTDCTDCSRCTDCTGCTDCSRCTDCTGCTDCTDCTGCTDCTDCSRCSQKRGIEGENREEAALEIPVIPNIHQAIYELASAPKALDMGSVHVCETTHCRAGWVIHHAGQPGYALEDRFGFVLAAMMIYDASAPNYKISPCRFFEENEVAMRDMKQLAEAEAAVS